MKLQLYVQQVNGALEETSQSVLSSLPRILRDTQLLQQETLALREKMVAVKQEIAKVGTPNFFKYLYLTGCNNFRKHWNTDREGDSLFNGNAGEDWQDKNGITNC